jgi:Calcineurin-like phosphoesterase
MIARSRAVPALALCLAAASLQAGSSETRPALAASGDRARPTAPNSLRVLRTSTTSVAVAWGVATDNVRVTGYRVFRGGLPRAAVAASRRTYVFTGLACGKRYKLAVQARDAARNLSRRSVLVAATADCRPGDPVIAAAGDLCSTTTDCAATAALVDRIDPDRILTLGDNAYEDGSASEFTRYYDPNWGRFKARTSPSPGNHDYHTSGAKGYFDYFGDRAPGEYYSFDLGAWHLISLNSEISASSGSPQDTWLKADLAAHPSRCILAYWHRPRFSSGREHGSSSSMAILWRRLQAARADVILVSHEHNYERFANQNADGVADAQGVRQFVVGTGGASLYRFARPIANSEVRNSSTHGVLEMVLHPAGYDWRFVPAAGASFTDAGSGRC